MIKRGADLRKAFLFLIFLLSLIFLSSGIRAASLSPDDFQYSAGIKGPIKNKSMYQVILSREILQKCSLTSCNDLRLSDQNNNEIPYVIIRNISQEKPEKYRFEIINYEDDPYSAVITVKLPEKYRSIRVISLIISDRDFKKNVILHGSHDMKKWVLLAEDNIYDFSSQINLRKTDVKFGKSDYRYYRLQLIEKKTAGADDETFKLKYKGLDFSISSIKSKKIRINEIFGQTALESYEHATNNEAVFTEFTSRVEEEKDTVIIVETNLPFNRIYFDISNPYFYRDVVIYFSDTGEKDSYKLLAHDVIYRFPLSGHKETKNYVDRTIRKQRFYKFIIKNNDNPPLTVRNIKFEWVQKSLYFIGLNDAEEHILFFGNPLFDQPHYDLKNFINQSNWFNHKYEKLEIASIEKNVNYKPAVSEDKQKKIEKTVLTVIIIIMVIGLSYWVYTLIRKTSGNKKG